jgi:hypothetical protein
MPYGIVIKYATKKLNPLGYDTTKNQPTSSPCYLLHNDFLCGLVFDLEDGSNKFISNIS